MIGVENLITRQKPGTLAMFNGNGEFKKTELLELMRAEKSAAMEAAPGSLPIRLPLPTMTQH